MSSEGVTSTAGTISAPDADPAQGEDRRWPTTAEIVAGIRDAFGVRALLVALAVGLVVAATGPLTGLLWAWVGPHVPVQSTSGGPILADYYGENAFAGEAVFGLIGLVVGLIVGIASYLLRRWRGPLMVLAIALGCLGAAWASAKVGSSIGRHEYNELLRHAAVGRRFHMPVALHAAGFLYVQPIVAAGTYVLLASWSRFSDLAVSDGAAADEPGPAKDAPPEAA